jgi:TonB family protein
VSLGKDGRVKEAKVLKSIPVFDGAAIKAVRRWRWAPDTTADAPAETRVILPVRFSLEAPAPPGTSTMPRDQFR